MALYPASDQFLVAAPTVGVRAVKKIDADLTRAAQGFDRRISVGLVVERRHRRAAETDRGPNQDPAQQDRCLKPARQVEAAAAWCGSPVTLTPWPSNRLQTLGPL